MCILLSGWFKITNYERVKEVINLTITISIFLSTAISFLIFQGLATTGLPKLLENYYALTIPLYIILYGTFVLHRKLLIKNTAKKFLIGSLITLIINLFLMAILFSGVLTPNILAKWGVLTYWIAIPLTLNIVTPMAILIFLILHIYSNILVNITKIDSKKIFKNKIVITIILISFILLGIYSYLKASYYLENKKYESLSGWFNAGFWISNSNCITAHNYYLKVDGRFDTTYNSIAIESKCTRDFNIVLTYPNILNFTVDGNIELIKNSYITNESKLILTVNGNKSRDYGLIQFNINTYNKFDFYSHYKIENYPLTSYQTLDFVFDGKKYICEGSCISIEKDESKDFEYKIK